MIELLEAVACFVVAMVVLAVGLSRLPSQWRRGRMLGRLGKPIHSTALDASLDKNVVLEGRLAGAGYTTTFVGAAHAVEEAHARAVTASRPANAKRSAIEMGDRVVALTLPVQVVLGLEERTAKAGRDVASVRDLWEGDVVRAVGKLVRVAATAEDGATGGGYRDRAVAYELHASDDATPPVVGLYAARNRAGRFATALLLLAPLPAIAWSVVKLTHLTSPTVPRDGYYSAAMRSECGKAVDSALDASDPWTARERAKKCDDLQGLAVAAWRMGDMPAAATAFATLRARQPQNPIALSEVESALLGDRPSAPRLVKQLQADWYRGPNEGVAVTLDCIADGAAATEAPMRIPCAGGPAQKIFFAASQGDNTDSQPNYALHGPELYARFVSPAPAPDTTRWGSGFPQLEALSEIVHQANAADRRMLHFAITGERAQYEEVARQFDQLSNLYPTIDAMKMDGMAPMDAPYATTGSFESERVELRFMAQKTLAVAATAAFFAFDDARLHAFLQNAESHARGIVEEDLRIQQGDLGVPSAAHSPSDYWDGEMKLFADADVDDVDPNLVAEEVRIVNASPAVLAAIVGHRPELAPAIRHAMDRGYCTVNANGFYGLLQQAFRRRFAAHVVGDKALEAQWLGVTQSLGAQLRAEGAFLPIDSLESLLAKPDGL